MNDLEKGPLGGTRTIASCDKCGRRLVGKEGVIHLRLNEAFRAIDNARLGILSPYVKWEVHCDSCNPHVDDDCSGCYWFDIADMNEWDWFRHTDWAGLVNRLIK